MNKENFQPIKAMLAHKTDPSKLKEGKLWVQPKFDGVRCLISKEGAYTRTGKEILSVNHILIQLEDFFKENPGIVLDGELYNHAFRNNFEDLVGLIKRQYSDKESLVICFHNYDMYSHHDSSVGFGMRHETLAMLQYHYGFNGTSCLKSVPTFEVKGKDTIDSLEQRFLDVEYEGAILRDDTPYKQGRSWGLQKIKRFMDSEFVVTQCYEGKGKLVGKLGKFEMKGKNHLGQEITFSAPATGHTHEQRAQLWEDRYLLIGTTWTVEYFELTKRGIPRFPVLKSQRNYE